MAPTNKANYKTFEAQARLIRAIVAAHPDTKWNYKEIVACYGSDMTEPALNHRFRRLRAEAIIVNEGRKKRLDVKNLPVSDQLPKTQGEVDVSNISKYFGQSTADGIQFQFRGIKKDAKVLQKTAAEGGDVANCHLPALSGASGGGGGGGSNSVTSTPSKPIANKPPVSKSTGNGSKRKVATSFKQEIVSDDDDDNDYADESTQDWSEKDLGDDTPTRKRPKTTNGTAARKNGTPSRRFANMTPSTVAASDVIGDFSESFSDPDPPATIAPASIFGNPGPPAQSAGNSVFSRGATDSLIGGGDLDIFGSSFGMLNHYGLGDLGADGEI